MRPTPPPPSDGVHPFIQHHINRQTSAAERMADRIAPEQNHQTIDFTGDAVGTVRVMTLSAPFNKIEHNLTAGKVYVYLGGVASGNPDYTLDATIPGPIYFPAKQHRMIAFVAHAADPLTNTNPTGRIHVENY